MHAMSNVHQTVTLECHCKLTETENKMFFLQLITYFPFPRSFLSSSTTVHSLFECMMTNRLATVKKGIRYDVF